MLTPKLALAPFTTRPCEIDIADAMIVARSKKGILVVHPLRVSFVHVVFLPIEKPQSVAEIKEFFTCAADVATTFIERHSTKAHVQRFLEKFSHTRVATVECNAWENVLPEVSREVAESSDFEVADLMSSLVSVDKIPYRTGIFVTSSEWESFQMHIISEDFRYLGKESRFLWNIFHSRHFVTVDVPNVDAIVAAHHSNGKRKMSLLDLYPILSSTATKCELCQLEIDGLESLRKHYFFGHAVEATTAGGSAEATREIVNVEAPAIQRAKACAARKRAKRISHLPVPPQVTTCKDDINAVTSLLMKWSNYYFELHLLKDSTDESDQTSPLSEEDSRSIQDGMRKASQTLEALQSMPCVEQTHRRQFLHIQRRIRNKIYGIEENVVRIA
ncbi:aprataxin [Perkinsela sp. CCAP 1560/4]|nr:aprataxin [Perkinsela sp. CCAP 1560/4]KNH09095.1 aprataxin [Perkinsela sp. CCAP 1560/4]|eukprot:KNH05326.1 aprataxin [Perkinsela sp. CCAP 1560/4]